MRGMRYLGGLAVLGSALAAWAWAQTGSGHLPPTNEQPDPNAQVAPVNPAAGAVPTPTPSTMPAAAPGDRQAVEPMRPARAGADPRTVVAAQPGAPAEGAEEQEAQGVNEKNPLGKQEPAVSIEWVGPPSIRLGRPADYTVVVRNACNIPIQQVMVRVRIPSGMTVKATEPNAISEGNVLMWELGTMTPKQERNLQVRMTPESKGNARCQAWVTFTGSTVMPLKICEPKLQLRAQAPEKVMIGDAATFVLTVHNPGDGPTDQVKIHAELSEGLEHVRGKKVDFEIGNLAAGESRSVQLICATKAGGIQTCDAIAEAEGDLRSQDKASVNVIMPKLDLEITGPHMKYLNRKANYVIKVTNPGDASATNVSVHNVIPAGFKFVASSDGGRHDFSTRTVTWFVGELGPAQSKEVHLECEAINTGEWIFNASTQAARGLRCKADLMTRVEGVSAILIEVVDTEDPIEVGENTSYEIRITNTGSKTETDIKLACIIPEQMQFKEAKGPARFQEQGKELVFEPIPKLAPRADAIFRIVVKAVTPGKVRFKTQITSTNILEPIIEMESTTIYDDSSSGSSVRPPAAGPNQ